MIPKRLPLLALLTCVLGTTFLSAQVTFTITATANSTAEGYTSGASYTFIFTTDGSRSATDYGSAGSYQGSPYYETTLSSETDIWSSISGTGLAGSYITPSGDATFSKLNVTGSPGLTFEATDETESGGEDPLYTGDIGLNSLGGTDLVSIRANVSGSPFPDFSEGNLDSDVATYFSDFTGTYSSPFSGDDWLQLQFYTNGDGSPENYSAWFTVNSVRIATSAVPEPGTYALIFGCGVLGWAGWRRRRSQLAA
ncbi:PEP-CTERM sorting domain-containing protein [Actomonas aquatica]|uniref:PEP-CTERM sorting domain-containing protein n=1 Tax=Actomonas aquatica TaxID=2866162 RepID=A0ABZ1CB75_9BACT|nr:PEP-CTERM sorting domain-containing protein [Opitutus sp. WL0086]WRQ88806.1 PEP-CTERM sorting domain-containing protein [Opitutus sp. WL0086]